MKKLLSVLAVMVMVIGLLVPVFSTAESENQSKWVNCADGKRLNLRAEPRKGASILDRIDCGKKVEILDDNVASGWAYVKVESSGKCGYVMTKFLVSQKPGKYEITEREDNFRAVNPYLVEAKPRSRKSDDSVCLRVKPNKTASAIRRLVAGEQLQVIAVGKTWSQVIDPETGRTGFVANDYMTRL